METDAIIPGGAAARRKQNRQEMRSAILDVARQIVDQEGVAKLTVRGIAQRLGYSAGAIYDYFPSKEHIVHALFFLGTDGLGLQMQLALDALPPDCPTLDAMFALAHTYREFAHRHVDLYWLAFSGLRERPDNPQVLEAEEKGNAGFSPLIAIIQEGVANGTLVDTVDPLSMAVSAWTAVHGFVSLELSGHLAPQVLAGNGRDGTFDLDLATLHDRLFDDLVRMVLYGFVRRRPD